MDQHTLVIFMVLEEELQRGFINELEANGVKVIIPEEVKTEESIVRIVLENNADMVLAGGEPWNAKTLSQCRGTLKMISKFGVGFDNIDLEAAKENGIIVTNTPGQNANAVAEMAMAMILGLRRKLKWYDTMMQNDRWGREFAYELTGKTVGLVGFGNIAKHLARMLGGFGCNIIAYDIYFDEKTAEELGVKRVTLDELFAESDVISLHCPLNDETRDLVRKETIAKMKDGVWIINTSRGGTVNVDDLKEALDSGKVAGAGLDVHPKEPVKPGYILKGMDNVILSPHAATTTREAMYNMTKYCFVHLNEYLSGSEITNRLTK